MRWVAPIAVFLAGNALETRFKVLLVVLAFGVLSASNTPIRAASLTGAEIFDSPLSSFPAGLPPTVSGTSLILSALNPFAYEKLLEFRAIPASNLPANGSFSISAMVNVTRLMNDIDPYFLFGNGSRLFGIVWSDNFNGGISAVAFTDSGNVGTNLEHHALIQDLGFPAVGEADAVSVTLTITDTTTTIDGVFRAGQNSHSWSELFFRANGISFYVFGDNGGGEQYPINSLTISAVTEPETYAMILIGLAFVARAVRRQKSKIARTTR